MNDSSDRRRSQDGAIDAIFRKLDTISTSVTDNHAATIKHLGDINTKLEVHITEDKAVAKTVGEHEEKWKGVEKAKNRGLIFAGIALLSSGALGAWGKDIAIAAKKIFFD